VSEVAVSVSGKAIRRSICYNRKIDLSESNTGYEIRLTLIESSDLRLALYRVHMSQP
jgi:hypothetical protein